MAQPKPYRSQIHYKPQKELTVEFRQKGWRNFQLALRFGGGFVAIVGLVMVFLKVQFIGLSAILFMSGIFIAAVSTSIDIKKGFLIKDGKFDFLEYRNHGVDRSKFIKYSSHLDFKIKLLSEGVKVSFLDAKFVLKDIQDLPILTESIADILNLEIYENYRLSDKTEILTYKAKRVVHPNFPSFLDIQRTPQRAKIKDSIIGKPLLTIDNFTTSSNKMWIGKHDKKVFTQDVKKITVGYQQILWGFKSFIWIKVELNQQISSNKFVAFFQRLFNQRLTYTGFRDRKDELTNRRDVQELYSHLKLVDSLKHVEIVKQ